MDLLDPKLQRRTFLKATGGGLLTAAKNMTLAPVGVLRGIELYKKLAVLLTPDVAHDPVGMERMVELFKREADRARKWSRIGGKFETGPSGKIYEVATIPDQHLDNVVESLSDHTMFEEAMGAAKDRIHEEMFGRGGSGIIFHTNEAAARALDSAEPWLRESAETHFEFLRRAKKDPLLGGLVKEHGIGSKTLDRLLDYNQGVDGIMDDIWSQYPDAANIGTINGSYRIPYMKDGSPHPKWLERVKKLQEMWDNTPEGEPRPYEPPRQPRSEISSRLERATAARASRPKPHLSGRKALLTAAAGYGLGALASHYYGDK